MARLRTCMLLAVFLLQILSAGYAIGISPSAVELLYAPGQEQRLRFVAINTLGGPVLADMYAEGELADYIILEKTQLVLKPKEAKEFYARLNLPDGLDPGTHNIQIGIIERGNFKANSLSGRAGVKSNVVVNVPFVGKFLKAKLSANTVNIGEPVEFTLEVRNLGKEKIANVAGTITIFEGQEKVGFADVTKTIRLESLASATLPAQWRSTKGGHFVAVADVIYDELSTQAKTDFKVGSLIVDIIDIIYDEIFAGEIGKIQVRLESRWNSKLENVFTEVFIYKDGILLSNTKSKPFSIEPWGAYTDIVYIDTNGFEPGAYDGKVAVHHGDKTAEQAFRFALKNRKQFDALIYLIVIILAISAFVLSIVYSMQNKRKNEH